MKFRTYGIILSLFFALGLVFSLGIEAPANHGDGTITAQEVAGDPGNEQKMKDFVGRIVDYYNHVRADNTDDQAALIRELTIFARDIRREGIYRHDDIYAIGVTDNNVITNHARYPELIGYRINRDAGTPLANTFKALLDNSAVGDTNCENYGQDQDRVACAAKVVSDLTVDVTTIAGLHHEADSDSLDAAFEKPDCSGLELTTTAKQVFDDPTNANLLKAYVKDVIRVVQEDVGNITVDGINKLDPSYGITFKNLPSLGKLALDTGAQTQLEEKVNTRIQERLFCFGDENGDFRHENIYVFVMDADLEKSTVLVNGNSFDLNGNNLELVDDMLSGEQNIAKLFNKELGDSEPGASAFVNYHWDDPTDSSDDVPNFFEDGKVPGTSPKTSYIEVADLNEGIPEAISKATGRAITAKLVKDNFSSVSPPALYIFGSGVYGHHLTGDPAPPDDPAPTDNPAPPDTPTADAVSGGGCAITEAGNTSQSALLNLFIAASVLFSIVFLRRRA